LEARTPRELAHADAGRPVLRQPLAADGAGGAAGAVVAAAADSAGAAAAELPRHSPADGPDPAGGDAGAHAALASAAAAAARRADHPRPGQAHSRRAAALRGQWTAGSGDRR